MKHGYISLGGVITDPTMALDKILTAYFHADTTKHGIDIETRSLRSDMVDGEDITGNIEDSLNILLSAYFDVYVLEVIKGEVEDNVRSVEVLITVTDNGTTVTFEKLLNLENGAIKSISEVGHL